MYTSVHLFGKIKVMSFVQDKKINTKDEGSDI